MKYINDCEALRRERCECEKEVVISVIFVFVCVRER